MAGGTVEAYRASGGAQAHFGAATAPVLGHITYIGLVALIVNLVVTSVLTPVFRMVRLKDGYDGTKAADYSADPATASIPVIRPGVRFSANGASSAGARHARESAHRPGREPSRG